MSNIATLLFEAGGTLDDIVKVTIYLVDPRDLSVVNTLRVMWQRLQAPSWAPARAASRVMEPALP